MKKILIILAILPFCLTAQGQRADEESSYEARQQESPQEAEHPKEKKDQKILTGFSGGMLLHGGYLFSDSPEKVFSNTGLGSTDYVKNLPNDGFCFGLGGMLRMHLIDHIHLGAEGFVSTMPLMKTGSNIRMGWGGALCDYYGHWGSKVRPIIGMSVGGGAMRRLYVPDNAAVVVPNGTDSTIYNASYSRTPFFYMDPYVGMEIGLSTHSALIIRLDYLLPFGYTGSGLAKDVRWGNFVTPSGVRLYVGVMFGNLKKKK